MRFFSAWALALGGWLTMSVQAQSLDEAWHGRWSGGGVQLQIGAKSFRVDRQNCRWVGAEPKQGFKGCVAYFSSTTSKAQLLDLTKERAANINEFVKQKMYDASTAAAERKSLAQTRALIDRLGTGPIKTVVTQDSAYEGSGDCMSAYFEDQGRLYTLLQCAGGDGGFGVTEMKKHK